MSPYQGTYGGGSYDAFVTKFDSSGTALSYSTYLGGSQGDYGTAIGVDGSGNAYVVGYTRSTDFPAQNAYQGNNAGERDAFTAKIGTDAMEDTDDDGIADDGDNSGTPGDNPCSGGPPAPVLHRGDAGRRQRAPRRTDSGACDPFPAPAW